GESEQEALDERRESVDALLVLLDLRTRVTHLRARRQERLDFADQLRRRDAVLGLHADEVELALLVEELLRGRDVEDGHRGAADRDPRELDDAGDLDALHAPAPLG